jgi:membrane-bound serine protease (ClpP class)
MKRLLVAAAVIYLLAAGFAFSQENTGFVAVMRANMMILPGTSEYLKSSIKKAGEDGAKILIVELDTPGGMLNTTQEMVQEINNSDIPVVIYVTPSGATAASAGVFVTLAGHIAAMSPGTSIGAAHPVSGDGKDIEGDMRQKTENITVAMMKSISEQRGRNVTWAEKAIRESSSITANDALKMQVIDVVAEDIDSLLKQLQGKHVKLRGGTIELGDYSKLAKKNYEISFKQQTLNTFANPNVLALLWLAATTGISIELYNPGAVLPGVVGLISLVLALAVSQTIPITQGGIILIVIGALMIASELFVTSGVLGLGGIISLILGSIYLVDTDLAPGLSVDLAFIIPTAITLGSLMLFLVYNIIKTAKKQAATGKEGMIGKTARAISNFSGRGRVFVDGEVWNAELPSGLAQKDEILKITEMGEGLSLIVEKIPE